MTRPDPTQPLRVTFLATVVTPPLGMENALLRLATALGERHEVEILTLHDPGPIEVRGVTITSLDKGTDHRSRRALRRRLRSTAPAEVLVVTGVWAGAQLLLAAPWRFRAAVAWEHSLTPHRLTTSRRFRLRAESVARGYRHCAAVVSVSPVVASALRQGWGVESVIVPNLLDLPERSPGSQRRGGWGNARDRATGPRPAARARRGQAGEELRCVDPRAATAPDRLGAADGGGGSQQPELQALAKLLGVGDRIQWLGYVSDPAALMADSDLLVHPSASETFGYVLFEAAERWLPVVATDAPVMNTLVPDFVPGLLTKADPPSLAATIGSAQHQFVGPQVTSVFLAADKRRRREFDAPATLAAWEVVLRD